MKCRQCGREYKSGHKGNFCSDSCVWITWNNYTHEVKEKIKEIYHKYFG